ncbi:MAG TPA: LptF/LptG family permease [Bacteroidota bacterium]
MRLPALHRQWILWRYILRAHVGPFLFSFCTLMFLFLLQFIMKFVDQLVGKGLSGWVIMELIALNLAWMVVLAVPMSVLVATLMAFGDMSSKNEITAMKASGVSLYRMLAPVAVMGLLICLGLIYFNNSILPDANHRLKNLANDIRRKKPTLSLVNGVFSQDIPGYSILVRRVIPNTNDLEGVTIYDYTNPTGNVVITAVSGTISFSPDYRKLIMDLKDGEIHELDLQKLTAYRRVRFEKHRIAMDVQGFDFERTNDAMGAQRGDRELSAGAMQVIVDSLDRVKTALEREFAGAMRRDVELRANGMLDSVVSARPGPNVPAFLPVTSPMLALRQTQATVTMYTFRLENLERQLDQYLVEINKKYSIPVACLVFVLVGVPLGIMSRRGGFGVAATLSLGFFILYWACLIGGEKLADRDIVQPFVGMWIANVLIGIVGIYLTVRIGRESILIDWTVLTRLIPRRWRTRLQDELREDEVEA